MILMRVMFVSGIVSQVPDTYSATNLLTVFPEAVVVGRVSEKGIQRLSPEPLDEQSTNSNGSLAGLSTSLAWAGLGGDFLQ